MSRHTLPLPRGGRLIVGYDRPTNAYFCQEWTKKGDSPKLSEDCVDMDELEEYYKTKHKLTFPQALRGQLVKEVLGEADTNTVMTWKWDT